jgi:hypothetical protein
MDSVNPFCFPVTAIHPSRLDTGWAVASYAFSWCLTCHCIEGQSRGWQDWCRVSISTLTVGVLHSRRILNHLCSSCALNFAYGRRALETDVKRTDAKQA